MALVRGCWIRGSSFRDDSSPGKAFEIYPSIIRSTNGSLYCFNTNRNTMICVHYPTGKPAYKRKSAKCLWGQIQAGSISRKVNLIYLFLLKVHQTNFLFCYASLFEMRQHNFTCAGSKFFLNFCLPLAFRVQRGFMNVTLLRWFLDL